MAATMQPGRRLFGSKTRQSFADSRLSQGGSKNAARRFDEARSTQRDCAARQRRLDLHCLAVHCSSRAYAANTLILAATCLERETNPIQDSLYVMNAVGLRQSRSVSEPLSAAK